MEFRRFKKSIAARYNCMHPKMERRATKHARNAIVESTAPMATTRARMANEARGTMICSALDDQMGVIDEDEDDDDGAVEDISGDGENKAKLRLR